MTWSIVAHEPATGAFAVAVATRSFAVGANCPYVRSGVGAVSTQSLTNRYLGPAVLDLMQRLPQRWLLDATIRDGPQIVTRRGVVEAVLVPVETWRRLESGSDGLPASL